MKSIVFEAARRAWKPPEDIGMVDWLESNVIIKSGPKTGKLDIDYSPWLKPIFEDYADNSVREIVLTCPVQSGKTIFLEAVAIYSICEHPGDMMIFAQTDEAATEFMETRFLKRLHDTEKAREKLPSNTRQIKKDGVIFPDMFLLVKGGHARNNLQSKSCRYVFIDEGAYWPQGNIGEARKRTTAYDRINSKRVITSTPLENHGDFFNAHQQGQQSEWLFICPKCKKEHAWQWKNVKWDNTEETRPNGIWRPSALLPTIRYECPNCDAIYTDDHRTRWQLAELGRYEATNDLPRPDVRSYHWSSLAVHWISWGDLVLEFLQAREQMKRGDTTQLREFVTKRLGEFWIEEDYLQEKITLTGGFSLGEEWENEYRRYLTVDVQKDYFVCVCRIWAKDGRSRLYHAEIAYGWDSIRTLQTELGINDKRVFIDCGFERTAMDVYRNAARYGWFCVMGDRAKFYNWRLTDQKTGRKLLIKRPYSRPDPIDSGIGLQKKRSAKERRADLAMRIMWSNHYIKSIYFRLISGRGAEWGIAADAPDWYLEQLKGEVAITERDKKTGQIMTRYKAVGANHALDCECLQIVAAHIEKLFNGEVIEDEGESEQT